MQTRGNIWIVFVHIWGIIDVGRQGLRSPSKTWQVVCQDIMLVVLTEVAMYGTVARMKVRPGALEALKRFAEAESNSSIKGYKAQYVYQMDNDPNEVYVVVVFDSKESYFANADSPEQSERYGEMMKYLAGEPEWHDGEIIYAPGF
jgi:heme-degrading monooxygenase HmoA